MTKEEKIEQLIDLLIELNIITVKNIDKPQNIGYNVINNTNCGGEYTMTENRKAELAVDGAVANIIEKCNEVNYDNARVYDVIPELEKLIEEYHIVSAEYRNTKPTRL